MTSVAGIGLLEQKVRRVAAATPGAARCWAVLNRAAGSRWQEMVLLLVAIAAVAGIRETFASWASSDYTIYLSHWWAFLQSHGFNGLGQEFADYNVPYLYLLWLGTLTPFSGLEWVKLLSAAADASLALGAYLLLARLGVARFTAALSAVAVLLLPEVLLNSAIWGQADSLYTGLIVWSLALLVGGRPTRAWMLYALALAFKLQAVFVLPALALAFVIQRHRVRTLLAAGAVFVATWIPAVVAGRSIPSLLSVYSKQAGQYRVLTIDAPNLYQWLPEAAFDEFKKAGMLFAVAVCAVLLAVLLKKFRSAPLTGRDVLVVATVFALLLPFTLPAMHERYFYIGGVLLFLVAVIDRRYVIAALAAQIVAVQVYTPNLFGQMGIGPVLPEGLLALVELGILVALLRPYVGPHRPASVDASSADVAPAHRATPSI